MESTFFKSNIATQPHIQLRLLRAEQISDIPLAHLDETVFVSDFDFTIKFPRFVANNNRLTRQGACLRGGALAWQMMQQLKKLAGGYYLVSAASPGKMTAEALVSEMRQIYIQEKTTDISAIFVDQTKPISSVLHEFKTLVNKEGYLDTFPRCYIYDNIVLNEYDKAAGTILKIKSEPDKSQKISQIIFVDDFILNAFYYPNDFMMYLVNIKDKLADTVTITSVWLDPTAELAANTLLKNIVLNGYENSFSQANESYTRYFSKDPNACINLADYQNMITSTLSPHIKNNTDSHNHFMPK